MRQAVGVYVHVPFCASKCAYCDFVSYPSMRDKLPAYVDALVAEIAAASPRAVSSVYVGGGTPTLLESSDASRILSEIRHRFEIQSGAETTIEANPDSVGIEKLRGLREAGFNRISIGVQSLDDNVLRTLGRRHDSSRAVEAVREAREAGFENLSIDLIFGVPGETLASWAETLEKAVSLAPDHVSAYCLSLEEGTALARRCEAGELEPAGEDLTAEMMTLAVERLAEAAYEHYEISNFARPGRRCAHNVDCWRYRDYIGFGPSAHSKIDGTRRANTPDVDAYIDIHSAPSGRAPSKSPDAAIWRQRLSAGDVACEATMLGLRMLEGMPRERLSALWTEAGEEIETRLRGPKSLGLVEVGERVRLTGRGLLLANEVFSAFV